jgi:esterase/lipase
MLKTILICLFGLLLVVAIVYLLGPKAKFKDIEFGTKYKAPALSDIDAILKERESKVLGIKDDTYARIIWADSTKKKTAISVLYLHGFSASQEEGDPLHINFAKRYNANLYLPRLEGHGLVDTNSLKDLTPDNYFESAEEALKIAESLGDTVVIISCSTGGTLSILLDKMSTKILGHIFYSPNIDLFDPSSDLITKPWGVQILKGVLGGEHNRITYIDAAKPYWNEVYHVNAIVALKWMVQKYMTPEQFASFKSPFFMGYYYKDEDHQDNVVSVPAMLDFYEKVGTPLDKKKKVAFTEAGAHVISSYVFSKEIEKIQAETFKFADEVLGLKKYIK